MDLIAEDLTLAWWNTALSPVGKQRASDDQKRVAQAMVQLLFEQAHVGLLALGEITDDDLASLRGSCSSPTLSIYNGTLRDGRLQFDTGVIYDSARLTIIDDESLIMSVGNKRHKVANLITFATTAEQTLLHVFVAHWPSRAFTEENIGARKDIAEQLKSAVNKIEEVFGNPSIIILGDFNDEPFDESLTERLCATRDREVVCNTNGFLYNPFWRLLGESEPFGLGMSFESVGGSCFYRNGTKTRWRTVDQILFSKAFLGDGAWHLNESATAILRPDFLVSRLKDSQEIFDHLPVISLIERKIKGEPQNV
jgi:hypothetical protein